MAAIMEVSVVPVGKEGASLSLTAAEVLKVAQEHNLNYQLNPMGATIEGHLDALFAAAREMHEAGFAQGHPRVITTIKIDDRRDKYLTMKYKINSVMAKLPKVR